MQRVLARILHASCVAATGLVFQSLPAPAQVPPTANTPAQPHLIPMVSLAPLLEKVLPAVVSVRVTGSSYLPAELTPGEPVPAPQKRAFRSGGSGVIVDANLGLIGTNNHVVKDAETIAVGLQDGREAPAELVGVDYASDIAIIKISLPDLSQLPLGNSADLHVGDFIIAVGNPFGLEGTATLGIVSGLMRADIGYDIYESFIQIDAAVNPGNSGGALVNLKGELVGINTAVGRQGAGSVGIAFAIPINMAKRIGMQLNQKGRMERGSLGLQTRDIPPSIANDLRLSDRRGALIAAVSPESTAARAGIKAGSIVAAFNGDPIRNNSDYMAHFGSSVLGEVIELEIMQDGRRQALKLTISNDVGQPQPVALPRQIGGLGGLTMEDIPSNSPLFGRVRGTLVRDVETGSPAANAGLQAGDAIVEINSLTISAAGQIAELVRMGIPVTNAKIVRQGRPFTVRLPR